MSEYIVLCVDDDEAIRELYEVAFMTWGHCAITAADGPQALEVLRKPETHLDAVLLDYEMPEMNGVQLAAEIKRTKPDLPVVMVSGNAEIMRHAPPFVDITMPKGSDLGLLMSQIEKLVDTKKNPKPTQRIRWTLAESATA